MTNKMHCQCCGGTAKLYRISAKCSDMCHVEHIGGKSHDGYVPEWLGPNGFGDYVELTICRHCGHCDGQWPHYNKEMNQFKSGKAS